MSTQNANVALQDRPHDDNELYAACVLCGNETNMLKNTNVEDRDYYVEGCGQLCQACYFKVYGNI